VHPVDQSPLLHLHLHLHRRRPAGAAAACAPFESFHISTHSNGAGVKLHTCSRSSSAILWCVKTRFWRFGGVSRFEKVGGSQVWPRGSSWRGGVYRSTCLWWGVLAASDKELSRSSSRFSHCFWHLMMTTFLLAAKLRWIKPAPTSRSEAPGQFRYCHTCTSIVGPGTFASKQPALSGGSRLQLATVCMAWHANVILLVLFHAGCLFAAQPRTDSGMPTTAMHDNCRLIIMNGRLSPSMDNPQ
jgi:hypothetical protein